MIISGNTLPALPNPTGEFSDQSLHGRNRAQIARYKDTEQQSRQQTVEFVLRGELVDEITFDEQNRSQTAQQIDPANRYAISTYIDINTASLQRPQRQGRMLDLFI
jgi:CRP-like cAMP-binding protein